MAFKEYLVLSDSDQEPIDAIIVKERTVARLIIKNSLNDDAQAELVEKYSINNNSCYPNTISEALSLLVTFKMKPVIKTEDNTIVAYHEKFDYNGDDVDMDINSNDQQPDIIEVNDISQADDTHKNE
jgi:hypothetical protein